MNFNIFRSGNANFGVNEWHYYFSNALPSLLTISILPLITYLIRELFIYFALSSKISKNDKKEVNFLKHF